jgi:hypothetical protein
MNDVDEVEITFVSGRTLTVQFLEGESFESFWNKAIEEKFFVAGDLMFNVNQVESAEWVTE